ncbi:XisI protein [Dolichospermum sp. UHCC 0260]|uniref:XisI protein n=1 Tax=unclassified Dolichospermum TaxID=2622029 RepID=UPI0014456772|nr:XisI protein [Dolichospermum sp. UHCC 0260]
MEKLDYPELVQQVLATHTDGHWSEGTEIELIFDIQRNRYLVIHIGWEGENRTYGTMIHVDIKDGKIWIQRDLTEEGVANELVELGVPKSDIVLAFRAPHIRQFTDFAQD